MPDHQHNKKKYDLKEEGLAVPFGSDDHNNDNLEEKIVLNTFVPLSDVKHSAPPGWVSKANRTLPPTGKAETVKLRTLHHSATGSGQATSEIRPPRPRSTHLSPYRNQQHQQSNVAGSRISNNVTNVPGKVITNSSRCGSLSPSSVSPTRLNFREIDLFLYFTKIL